jgi:hypothetical protein
MSNDSIRTIAVALTALAVVVAVLGTLAAEAEHHAAAFPPEHVISPYRG